MNAFEEHQLFIPIINDSRFAIHLRNYCDKNVANDFVRQARHSIRIIARENDLSLHDADIHEVTEVLWAYYENQLKEERTARNNAVYAAEGFAPRLSRAERELSSWKQTVNRTVRVTDELIDKLNATHASQQLPKESPIMATPTFATITYVSGKPLNELTNEDLIAAIKACEKEIESLREVKRTSTKVAAKIAELDNTADKIRDALDARA